MREYDVRTQVSGARSAQNDPGLISSAVKQTPLTATLLPGFSSYGVLTAVMVSRRFSPRCSMRVTRPTSSTILVNMRTSIVTKHHKPTTEARRHRERSFLYLVFSVTPCLRGETEVYSS